MKKFVRGIIGVTAYLLLIGTAGGYEQGLITTTDVLIRTTILGGISILCMVRGERMKQLKRPTAKQMRLMKTRNLLVCDWLVERDTPRLMTVVSRDGKKKRNIYKEAI